MTISNSILDSIGNTPLLRMNQIVEGDVRLLAKLESFNPMGSVKDRIARAMVEDAEARGLLHPGGVVIEPTSGNTGIGLAFVCAVRGYRVVLTMPETMSAERRRILQAFGAEVILTPGDLGMKGAVEEAEKFLAATPDAFMPAQFDNPANPRVHEETTGPEIWNDADGAVDVLVAGIGTESECTDRRGRAGWLAAPERGEDREASDSGDRGRVHPRCVGSRAPRRGDRGLRCRRGRDGAAVEPGGGDLHRDLIRCGDVGRP